MPERGAGGKEPVSGSIKYSISRFEAGGVDVFAVFWRFIWWRRILVGVGGEGMSWFVWFPNHEAFRVHPPVPLDDAIGTRRRQ